MAKKKACKQCSFINDADVDACVVCGSNNFANTILGRIVVIQPNKSKIAEFVSAEKQGEYAIKMR